MAQPVRFKTGEQKYKARIFEQGSQKRVCAICNEKKFGVLVRHVFPEKKEVVVCNECLVLLTLGKKRPVLKPVKQSNQPSRLGKMKRRGRPKKVGPKKGTRHPKIKCPECGMKISERQMTNHYRSKHPDIELIDKRIEESNDAETNQHGASE